jgi:DNA-binding CsgD family transcriptional regulator
VCSSDLKAFWRLLFIWVPSAAAFAAAVFILVMKIAMKKRLEKFKKIADAAPEVDLESYNLTDREKEICKLLTTGLARKNIADVLGIAIPTVSYHTNNLYRKLGIQSRQELFVKLLKTEMPGDIEELGN